MTTTCAAIRIVSSPEVLHEAKVYTRRLTPTASVLPNRAVSRDKILDGGWRDGQTWPQRPSTSCLEIDPRSPYGLAYSALRGERRYLLELVLCGVQIS